MRDGARRFQDGQMELDGEDAPHKPLKVKTVKSIETIFRRIGIGKGSMLSKKRSRNLEVLKS